MKYKKGITPVIVLQVIVAFAIVGTLGYSSLKKHAITLKDIRYSSISFYGKDVTLKDEDTSCSGSGVKTCRKFFNVFVDGDLYRGDIDGDGDFDVATLLSVSCGDFLVCSKYVGVWLNENSKPVFLDLVYISEPHFDLIDVNIRKNNLIVTITKERYGYDPITINEYVLLDGKLVGKHLTSPETLSLKTYRNEKYGFEFEYPSFWGDMIEKRTNCYFYGEKKDIYIGDAYYDSIQTYLKEIGQYPVIPASQENEPCESNIIDFTNSSARLFLTSRMYLKYPVGNGASYGSIFISDENQLKNLCNQNWNSYDTCNLYTNRSGALIAKRRSENLCEIEFCSPTDIYYVNLKNNFFPTLVFGVQRGDSIEAQKLIDSFKLIKQ